MIKLRSVFGDRMINMNRGLLFARSEPVGLGAACQRINCVVIIVLVKAVGRHSGCSVFSVTSEI